MKKVISFIILTTLVLGTTFAAPKNTPLPELTPIELDSVLQVAEDGTKFVVDPRLEIIGIICRLAEYDQFLGYYNGEATYTTQIDNLFAKKKDHPAVKEAKLLKTKGIDSAAMVNLAYYIKPDFSGVIIDFDQKPDVLYEKWNKIKTKEIYKFIQQAHDFAIDSNYSRIFILNKPELLAQTGYIQHWFEKYHVLQITNQMIGAKKFQEQIISINMISPCYLYTDLIEDSTGKRIAYTTVYPGCNYLDLGSAFCQTNCVDLADKIWDETKDNYIAYVTSFIKKQMSEDDFKKYEKSIEWNSFRIAAFVSNFLMLEFLKSPEYIEQCKDEDYPVTYESVYSAFEKSFDGEYFERGVKVFDDYMNNRKTYPSLHNYSAEIAKYINSLPTE